jgi:acetyltransferase
LPEDWRPDAERVRTIVGQARAAGRTLLTEAEAKELLAAYGLPVTPTVACCTADEAAAAARRTGFPVVLKVLSTRLTHKSDAGGVQLNLADEAAVHAAFEQIRGNVARATAVSAVRQPVGTNTAETAVAHAQADAFQGVTVQPMVAEKGFELIIGSSADRQFGPVVLFGAGGVLVEVLHDRALGLPPLNRTLARRLMERTQIYAALTGVRGRKPVDLDALETMLARFSLLLTDFVEDIQEVDMNPVLAAPGRVVALDARVVLTPSESAAEGRPRLAIHPYPNQFTAPFRLRDGTEVVVRAIGPEDEPLIVDLHAGHSEHTIFMRFFSLVKTLSRDSLIRLCHLDYDREMALVAVHQEDGTPRMFGVSRYYLQPATSEAEFALVVGDAHQGQGLGRHLLQRLIAIARERGVKRLFGLVLRENAPMLALTRSLGFSAPETVDDSVVRVTLDMAQTTLAQR